MSTPGRRGLLSPGGFFWKLYGTYVAVVAVSAALVAVLVFQFFVSNARSGIRDEITQLANLIASLEAANPQELWTPIAQNRVEELANRSKVEIDIVLANGELVATSREEGLAGAGAFLPLPEFEAAIRTGSGETSRKEGSDDFDTLHVVRAIKIRSESLGYVRVSKYMGLLVPEIRRLGYQIGIGTLLAAGASSLGGVYFGRTVTLPLRQIEQGCLRIVDGNLGTPIQLERKDEFGVVADSVNRMAEALTVQLTRIDRQKRQSELLLRLLNDAVIAIDACGKVVFMNAAAESYCRCGKVEQCIGLKGEEAIAVPEIVELLDSSSRGAVEVDRSVEWMSRQGQRCYASVTLSPFDSEESELKGSLLVIRDTTERRRFERLRRDFASNVSHELKTPITAIATLIEALQGGAASEPELLVSFLERINLQNQRLKRLVEELLAISKLESGNEILKFKRYDIRETFSIVEATFQPMSTFRKIALQILTPEEPVFVKGDARALEVAINSLVDNAFKFTPEGGRVRIQLSKQESTARIEVEDTGCGISAEHQERVFERFYRIDAARTRDRGGSGLGLAIVKHMAIAHGGEVKLASELERGSRFTITLPLA